MSPASPSSSPRVPWLKRLAGTAFLVGFVLLILGGKFRVLHTTGSDLPIHDAWDAEAAMTLQPWLEDKLSFSDLLHPHNEHRLVTTKLYALALVALNGQWDNLVATVGSALVHTLCAVLLLCLGRRVLPPAWSPAFAVLLLLLFALPFAWANLLVGFQVQFYFLVLFTLAHLWLSLESDRFMLRWALGQLSAALAIVTLASGLFSSLAVLAALAHRAWNSRKLTAQQLATAILALAFTFLGWSLKNDVPGHAPLHAQSVSQFLSAFLHLLAWPGNHFFPLSLALFLPAAPFLLRLLRTRSASFADSTLLALFVWFVLQSAATAYARANADPLTSRYLDLVAFGPLLAFVFIIRELSGRSRRLAALVWFAFFGLGLHQQTRHLGAAVLHPEATLNRDRENAVRAYLVSGDASHLHVDEPWKSAYPDPDILQQRLASPSLQRLLPASVRRSLPLAPAFPPPVPAALLPAPYPVVFSSWQRPADAPPHIWRGATQPADTLPILRFRVAGHFGPDHPKLQVVIKTATDSVPLLSARSSLDRWKTINVVRPPGEWWIEITDADPTAWFALTEPVEVGRLSWLAGKLLKQHRPLTVLGLLLLLSGTLGFIWPRRLQLIETVRAFPSHLPSLRIRDLRPSPAVVLAILGLLWAALSLNLAWSVGRFQPNVLAYDQWDFLEPLFAQGGTWDLFTRQHGPHRQGAAFVITSWILSATDWDARADSLWIAALLSASALLALNLKRKFTGPLQLRDAWIPLVALSLGQFEALLITPNASHSVFPLFLLLLTANLWLTRHSPTRYLFSGLAAVCLTFTGFGLFAGAVLTALLVVSAFREWLAGHRTAATFAALATILSVIGWILFFSNYRFDPAVEGFRFPWTPLSDYARFLFLMLATPAGLHGATAPNYLLGALLAILLLLALASLARRWLRAPSPALEAQLLLLTSSLLFVCNTAVGRIPLGVDAGMSSRYLTLLFPLWLALSLAATGTSRRAFALTSSLALWTLALLPLRDLPSRPIEDWPGTLGATDRQYAHFAYFTAGKAAWADTYLKNGDWRRAQAEHPNVIYPDAAIVHLAGKLDYLRTHRLLFFAPGKSYHPYLQSPAAPTLTPAVPAAPDSDTHSPPD
jgi:4-amino-4-deoxy-L-arabinose transferase and related glycosyltransferases of PMT family